MRHNGFVHCGNSGGQLARFHQVDKVFDYAFIAAQMPDTSVDVNGLRQFAPNIQFELCGRILTEYFAFGPHDMNAAEASGRLRRHCQSCVDFAHFARNYLVFHNVVVASVYATAVG